MNSTTDNLSPVCYLPSCAIEAFDPGSFPLEADCNLSDFETFCNSPSDINQYLDNLALFCTPNDTQGYTACQGDADCCSGFQAGVGLVTDGCGVDPGSVVTPSYCSTTTTSKSSSSKTSSSTTTTTTHILPTTSTTTSTTTSDPTSLAKPTTTTTSSSSTTSKITPFVTSTTSTSIISIPLTVINPPPASPTAAPTTPGSQTTLAFPTTPFTGGPLLTGTCTIPEYTLVALSDGSLMEVPIIGCADNRPDCCPSLNPVTAPLSTATIVVTVVESTEAVAALSADPLTKCPSDYTDLGSVCCPYGFTLYSQQLLGQTPCYTILSTVLPVPPIISADLSSIASVLAKTATSPESTYSVQVVANEVFALNLPHKPLSHSLSVGTQAGIGVGASAGGLIFLLLLLWSLFLRRRLRRESQKVQSLTSSGAVMSPAQPTPSSPQSAAVSVPVPPQYQMPYGGYYAGGGQSHSPSPPAAMGPYGMVPPPPGAQQHQIYPGGMGAFAEMQVNPVEAESRLPRAGVPRMPDGRMYDDAVEMGVRTPPAHGLVQPQPLRNWR